MKLLKLVYLQFLKFKGLIIKGKNVNISFGTNFGNINNVVINGNYFNNKFCSILAGRKSKIIFKPSVLIGPNVTITSSNHDTSKNISFMRQKWTEGDVIIGSEVWIGANSVILPGLQIANGIIIGAGSVVTKSLNEEYSIYAGIPAKFIRKRI